MALTDEGTGNGFYMPVAPAYGGGYGNGGFGLGGDWAWILLLLLIGGGGWGFGGFGGGMWPMMMGGMAGGFGMDYLYPWLNNSQHISDGFRDQQITTYLNGLQNSITAGFGDVQNALCSGFSGVNANITNAQIANMQSIFGVQSALQNCCCENRAGLADVKYTIATEACADRAAVTQGIQTVLDKLCQLELDGVKGQLAQAQRENVGLQNQLNMAAMRESQTAQNAFISQGFANEVDALYNRLNTCPVPTTPVYGRTPIFTCGGNNSCGCNGNGFMN